jgi:hypothetical protein
MRLRACMAGLSLFATGCAELPGLVRIDVDGRTVELRQRRYSNAPLQGAWSTAPLCGEESRFDLAELGRSVVSVRVISADELELIGPEGTAVRLFRCAQ